MILPGDVNQSVKAIAQRVGSNVQPLLLKYF